METPSSGAGSPTRGTLPTAFGRLGGRAAVGAQRREHRFGLPLDRCVGVEADALADGCSGRVKAQGRLDCCSSAGSGADDGRQERCQTSLATLLTVADAKSLLKIVSRWPFGSPKRTPLAPLGEMLGLEVRTLALLGFDVWPPMRRGIARWQLASRIGRWGRLCGAAGSLHISPCCFSPHAHAVSLGMRRRGT